MKCHACENIMRGKGITDLNGVLLKISDVHFYVIDIEKQRNSKIQPDYQIKCYQSMHYNTKNIRRSNERDFKIRDNC